MTSRERLIRWQSAIWVALVIPLAAQAPEQLAIDPAETNIRIHVGRSGILAFAGHEHEIAVPAVQGQVALDRADVTKSTIAAEFDATALKVTGKGEPPEDVPEVQQVMLSERVLDVQKYPTITFHSQRIAVVQQSPHRMTLRVAGDLTLHGVTRSLSVPVQVRLTADGLTASGKATVRQRDFGIRAVTAGAGTVRVKDEVEIAFLVTARRR